MTLVQSVYAISLALLSASALAQTPLLPQKTSSTVFQTFSAPTGTTSLFPGNTAWTVTQDGALWLGTLHGLWRYTRSGWEYFGGLRYLASDEVRALASLPSSRSGVSVVTSNGVTNLDFVPMTLQAKASWFERQVEDRHNRHGMVADSILTRAGDPSTNQMASSDNDGLWTAMYGASQCFRYAVTKSEEARTRAVRSVEALLYLEQITGISGFPARSYIKHGEMQPPDGTWYDNPAEGLRWKADTSSDEIVGHFFLFSIAFDTLPDVQLKGRIAATTRRIMDHILSHGYNLIDRTGQPTRWGKWSPQYFASKEGRPDSALNALELLSFLRAARHITGDAKYDVEYQKVAFRMGYAKVSTRYLELAEEINYSDEELAMLSFYTLFRYERDAALLPLYREALEGWWHNERRERNPLWNLIYLHSQSGVAVTDRDRLLAEGFLTLQQIPLLLITWTVDNTHRRDVKWDRSEDRFNARQSTTWLPPDERPVMKWNGNPFSVNGGDGGKSEDDGSIYLLPYWLGRYWKHW